MRGDLRAGVETTTKWQDEPVRRALAAQVCKPCQGHPPEGCTQRPKPSEALLPRLRASAASTLPFPKCLLTFLIFIKHGMC